MPYAVAPQEVEPVVRGLLHAIDVDGGPTGEQLGILWSITDHLWKRPDLRSAGLPPLGPKELAAAITDERARQRFHLSLVTLELCRHPLTPAQVARAEEYEEALAVEGSDLTILRDLVDEGVTRAIEDWKFCFSQQVAANSEPALRAEGVEDASMEELWTPVEQDPEMVARFEEFAALPEGTLGREFIRFYERNGIALPGADGGSLMHAVQISHDMNHVIAGYEPTGQGEIALGAFQVAMDDSEANLVSFLGNLLVHEAGVLDLGVVTPKSSTLMRPGAIEMLGEAFDRGSRCNADFTHADHLAMAAWSVEEVREEYGVVPITAFA